MSVQIIGDYITINEIITIKISDIISIKPRSMVKVQEYTGNIIARDFPKIIILTNREEQEILYETDEERDEALIHIRKSITEYSYKKNTMEKQNSININVTDSSNVNIVSQSSNVSISQEIKNEVCSKIEELTKQLESINNVDINLKNDILECVNDIKANIESNKKVPKYSLQGLIDLTSKIASLSSLGIGIAQLLGA